LFEDLKKLSSVEEKENFMRERTSYNKWPLEVKQEFIDNIN